MYELQWNESIDIWMYGWTDGQNGWMDGWVDEWLNGYEVKWQTCWLVGILGHNMILQYLFNAPQEDEMGNSLPWLHCMCTGISGISLVMLPDFVDLQGNSHLSHSCMDSRDHQWSAQHSPGHPEHQNEVSTVSTWFNMNPKQIIRPQEIGSPIWYMHSRAQACAQLKSRKNDCNSWCYESCCQKMW